MLGLKCRTYSVDLLGYGYSSKPDPRCAHARTCTSALPSPLGVLTVAVCRQFPRNELYCFETWASQVLDFVKEVVGAPAFLICNSVGGALLKILSEWSTAQ